MPKAQKKDAKREEKRLRQIVYYIASRFPNNLSRTRLMKLVYLIDYKAKYESKLNRKITNLSYDFYHYGPFSLKLIQEVEAMDGHELVESEIVTPDGRVVNIISRGLKPREGINQKLDLFSGEEQGLIKEVVDEFGQKGFEELIKYVYDTEPIKSNVRGTPNVL